MPENKVELKAGSSLKTEFFDNQIASLLTAKDVGRILAISEKAVYRAAKLKKLPAITIGRAVRFRPEDIAEIRQGLRNL